MYSCSVKFLAEGKNFGKPEGLFNLKYQITNVKSEQMLLKSLTGALQL